MSRRAWLFPALLALLLFTGDLAANFMSVNIPPSYRPWMWAVIGLVAIAAVALAVWDARQPSAAVPAGQDFYSIYQQPAGRAQLSAEQFQRILEEYLSWADKAYARARLYGLESVRTAKGRPMRSLADVFVPITLRRSTPPSRSEVEGSGLPRSKACAYNRCRIYLTWQSQNQRGL